MKTTYYTFLLLMSLVFTSCYNDSDFVKTIDLPTQPPKVVVYGFLSPDDDSIRIYVERSLPVNDTTKFVGYVLSDATVTLSSNGKTAILPWYDYTQLYHTEYYPYGGGSYTVYDKYTEGGFKISTKDFPLLPGKRVDLTVATCIGMVTAYCTIPESGGAVPSVESCRHSTDNGQFSANILLNGFGQANEYYQISGEVGGISPSSQNLYRTELNVVIGNEFSVHKTSDPGTMKFELKKDYYYSQNLDADTLNLYLAKTDEAYYKYHFSLKTYNDTEGNPFMEPSALYTNIKGGLGVFAAYRKAIYRFPVKDYLK